jgi:multidrug efflux pump subunit AcrA (membrane-fusion protein)
LALSISGAGGELAAQQGLDQHSVMTRSGNRQLINRAIALAAAASLFLPLRTALAEQSESSDRAVSVTPVQRQCFSDTIQLTGVLVARKEILVRPDREGLQISEVSVQPGDSVKSGQVLARLTPPEGQPGGNQDVTAPAAGVITFSSAVVGSMASSRGPPLFQIAERGGMDLLAETPAKNLESLAPNQAAKIEVIGVGKMSGRIRLLPSAINPTTQLGQVRLTINEESRLLRAGAFGRATINLGERCGPAVPLSAVLYGADGAVVQVVRDNRVETRRVTVGLISGGQAEIREGVSQGEMVMARAGAFFRDGDRVRAVTAGEGSSR